MANGMVPTRRRERLRKATVGEIKELAWAQIAESGAADLSLRAIARDMGMTSSALYRYFSSRDELLSALVLDGFASLADTLEETEARISAKERWREGSFLEIFGAYRRWALDHPTQYALMFGTPVPGFEDCMPPEVEQELVRGVDVLFRVMINGLSSGVLRPPPIAPSVRRKLAPKLRRWKGHAGGGLPADALAACMVAWTQLHGAISLEVFGHMPDDLIPADDLFEHEMRQIMVMLGCDA